MRCRQILERTVGASSEGCRLDNGTTEAFDTVAWAGAYRDDSTWLSVDGAVSHTGEYVEAPGVSPIQGWFHVGRRMRFIAPTVAIVHGGGSMMMPWQATGGDRARLASTPG